MMRPRRTLNVYNLIAILLPGVAFVIFLVPFIPMGAKIDPLLTVLPLLAVGYVVGQALHTVGSKYEDVRSPGEVSSYHRQLFQRAINGNEDGSLSAVATRYVSSYDRKVRQLPVQEVRPDTRYTAHTDNRAPVLAPQSDFDLPESEFADQTQSEQSLLATATQGSGQLQYEQLRDAYPITRSIIHVDGRGRSRVFQSVYAFCRSMIVAVIAVVTIYILYIGVATVSQIRTISEFIGIAQSIEYTPVVDQFIGGFSGPVLLLITGAIALILPFRYALREYRRYYVQYTMGDFVALQLRPTPSQPPGGDSRSQSIKSTQQQSEGDPGS